MIEPTWTHVGWLLFAPIKLANPDSAVPAIAARWDNPFAEGVLMSAETFQSIMIFLWSAFNPGWEPHFFFTVTGKITSPSS